MSVKGSKKASSKRVCRQYSAMEKSQALALAESVGVTKSARKLGIPVGTLQCWRRSVKKAEVAVTDVAGKSDEAKGDTSTLVKDATENTSVHNSTSAIGLSNWKPYPKGVARVYTPSQRAFVLEYADKHGPAKTERDLGVTRFSISSWRRKVKQANAGQSVKNPLAESSQPCADEKEQRVISEWEKYRGLGPSQIRNQLRRSGLKVSVHFVRRVMEENGYVAPKVKRKNVHDRRYEAVRPSQLWHADFWHRHINKQKVYTLLILDDYSRFLVGATMWEGERVDAVIETFEEAVSRYGKPETMMSDGGSAFYAWRGVGRFTRILEEYGVDQLIAKTPQVNGKSEILNANLGKELFDQERFFDLGEAQRRLSAWMDFYNFKRTHHALGGLLVPSDRFFGRADRVLAAIEAGRNADGIGEPYPVGNRILDFLRVTSTGGRIEMYLMGQRIWPAVT